MKSKRPDSRCRAVLVKESAFESRTQQQLSGQKDETEVKKPQLIITPSPRPKSFISADPLPDFFIGLWVLLAPLTPKMALNLVELPRALVFYGPPADSFHPLLLRPDAEMERRLSRRLRLF